MDPYSSPNIIPNNSPHNPFPYSLLRTRQTTDMPKEKLLKRVNEVLAESQQALRSVELIASASASAEGAQLSKLQRFCFCVVCSFLSLQWSFRVLLELARDP